LGSTNNLVGLCELRNHAAVERKRGKLKPTTTTKMRETVKLISMEGFEFVIDREAAMVSQTIRSMLTSPGFFSSFVVELVIVIKILI